MVPLSFAGQDFVIVDRASLYWPREGALFVADLHFEKASWYARSGQMLPPYDSAATLDRLERAVAACGATSLWCLGDNFHDSDGASRLDPALVARLESLCARVAVHWITGNHDSALEQGFGGRVVEECALGGLALRHLAESQASVPELSGHFHPRLRVRLRGRSVSRPCFVRCQDRLILPAFGSLTGGMDADDPAILEVMGQGPQAIVATESKTVCFHLQKTADLRA
ncbi:ligase-associated DNA damage response endonuclease PdeM [Blastomonas sp. AAP53]|uniref:ligase-associated DNA damage response endonuclease PdeM n=1 Tax=Blastomonas sp. AAP53 TaxID=1248760 RepID=UPI000476D9E6|nr:ligase-associated DNA damage response endonuclease PdeM [Blastomonas sp. AAP53]